MSEQINANQEVLDQYVSQLELTARETVALFGLSGLDVQVSPGAGWSSAKTADKVILTIDPIQITAHSRDSETTPISSVDELVEQITQTDPRYIRHTICHELGHIRDFIDPTFEDLPTSKSDHFFWNVIDDAVIDKRLRHIPALDECSDELYGNVLFPVGSYEDQPKHVQLMYGLLVSSVSGNRPTLGADVQDIIDKLQSVQSGEAMYDIMQVLASQSTTLQERRLIAEHYIKPYFDALLEEDKQEDPEKDNEELYEQYQMAVHAGGHNDDQGDESESESDRAGNASGNKTSEGSSSSSPHSKLSEAGSMLKELSDEQQANKTQESKPDKIPSNNTIAALGAGSIAAELQLPKADAQEYLTRLNDYRSEIIATARAFETLAIPNRAVVSPRYTNRAGYSGNRLNTRRVAQAAIQMETGTEQAIWRQVEHRGKRVDFMLEKLDVHLLVDISSSMSGEKAEQAAATALMLMEGLELARHNLAKNSIRNQKPDVRLQVTAFGSDHQTISPLSYNPDARYKGQAFTALRHPDSWSTLVSGALGTVKQAVYQHPDRNQLVFIISDGGFADYDEAKKAAQALPQRSTQLIQLVIGSPSVRTITGNVSHLSDAKLVPTAVRTQLENYMAA